MRFILAITFVIFAMPIAADAIVIQTHSSASTGGKTATSGQSVVTGDSSAETTIRTVIFGDESGERATVEIRTTENGVKKEDAKSINVPTGEPLRIIATTSAKTKSVMMPSETAEAQDEIAVSGESSEVINSHLPANSLFKQLTFQLFTFFGDIFSLFAFF